MVTSFSLVRQMMLCMYFFDQHTKFCKQKIYCQILIINIDSGLQL